VEHVERVKWYGPHIRHLVVDVRCQPIYYSKHVQIPGPGMLRHIVT
jgi:hypothetical protein